MLRALRLEVARGWTPCSSARTEDLVWRPGAFGVGPAQGRLGMPGDKSLQTPRACWREVRGLPAWWAGTKGGVEQRCAGSSINSRLSGGKKERPSLQTWQFRRVSDPCLADFELPPTLLHENLGRDVRYWLLSAGSSWFAGLWLAVRTPGCREPGASWPGLREIGRWELDLLTCGKRVQGLLGRMV